MRNLFICAFILFLSSCQKEEAEPINSDLSQEVTNSGQEVISYLNPNLSYGSVTDIDGNEYATIGIGNQIWMAENLRTTKYCNGDPIPNITDESQWSSLTTGAWAHYNNDSQNETPYGKLYNWFTVNDPRNVCPCGWHVPTDQEWTTLADYLGGENIAGGKVKSIGTDYWQNPNTDATNESGFSGLPGGFRSESGNFNHLMSSGFWWSSTETTVVTPYAYYRGAGNSHSYLGEQYNNYEDGHSIRCIKD